MLEQRRVGDRASLIAQEQEARKAAIEIEAAAEAMRLEKLEERLSAYPTAARYDLEMARLRVAQQLAGNTRAVVSLGGGRPGLEPAAHPARIGRRGGDRQRRGGRRGHRGAGGTRRARGHEAQPAAEPRAGRRSVAAVRAPRAILARR